MPIFKSQKVNSQGSYPRQSASFKGSWGSKIKSAISKAADSVRINPIGPSIKRGALNLAGKIPGRIGQAANKIPRQPKTVRVNY